MSGTVPNILYVISNSHKITTKTSIIIDKKKPKTKEAEIFLRHSNIIQIDSKTYALSMIWSQFSGYVKRH